MQEYRVSVLQCQLDVTGSRSLFRPTLTCRVLRHRCPLAVTLEPLIHTG